MACLDSFDFRIDRIAFANTHFEEWWFKTFYNNYGNVAAYIAAIFTNTFTNPVKVFFCT